MKKTIIISIIILILILAGGGYYAYLKGLIKLDFLQKNKEEVVVENHEKEIKSDSEANSKYQGVYHFGESEGESDLILLYENGKYYAQIKSGFWAEDGKSWSWLYENLENVKIENNKLYSSISNGEFGFFDIDGQQVEGLKINKTWSANLSGYDIGEVGVKKSSDASSYYKIKKSNSVLSNGTWSVSKFDCSGVCALSDEEASQWIGKELIVSNNKISFEFSKIPYYKDTFKNEALCTILNLNNPDVIEKSYDTVLVYKTNCGVHPFGRFLLNKNKEISTGWDGVSFVLVKQDGTSKPPATNTTITYMCNEKVKIVREQDSPSLPPRVSYVRVSDGAGIASYGDFGAYIRPEYFSIDRTKIEQGYSFNKENFCKYLKN